MLYLGQEFNPLNTIQRDRKGQKMNIQDRFIDETGSPKQGRAFFIEHTSYGAKRHNLLVRNSPAKLDAKSRVTGRKQLSEAGCFFYKDFVSCFMSHVSRNEG